MIRFRVVLLQAEFNYNGTVITEDAAIELVNNYKPVNILINQTIPSSIIGTIDSVVYDKEVKSVIGTITIKGDITLSMSPKNTLETPEGNRVLETTITQALLRFIR